MESGTLEYLSGFIPLERLTLADMDKVIRKGLSMSLISFVEGMAKLVTARARLLVEYGVDLDINTNISVLEDGVIFTMTMRVRGYDVERLKGHLKYFIDKGPYTNYEKTLFYNAVIGMYRLKCGEEQWRDSTLRAGRTS